MVSREEMDDTGSPYYDGGSPTEDERLERIHRAFEFVPLNLYDEITKLAEAALGEILTESQTLQAQAEGDEFLEAAIRGRRAAEAERDAALDREAGTQDALDEMRVERDEWQRVARDTADNLHEAIRRREAECDEQRRIADREIRHAHERNVELRAERDRLAEELEWVGELNKANIENANRLRETAAEMERALLRTQAIAMRGVGPDTTPEEALATIAAYVEKRLNAITAAQREGLE
jgi:hypothetical protein